MLEAVLERKAFERQSERGSAHLITLMFYGRSEAAGFASIEINKISRTLEWSFSKESGSENRRGLQWYLSQTANYSYYYYYHY
jgi:hypothetical protein